ncbi:hypothetical protein [Paenibacillus tengchongensis]|uniref:hypothetical protein n=1 Tax=Paenibacillus tengchongensis TaxID=2608684 RepID=UPI00124D0E63|nr:hypothetical protein [Paenibacillus tengchongensis]
MVKLSYMTNDISVIENISSYTWDTEREDKYDARSYKIRSEVYKEIKHIAVDRIYYGAEFCEFLIPTLNEVKRAIDGVKMNYELTFLTPVVTDYGIKRLEEIFDYLAQYCPGIEIVFNDWGVFKLLQCNYPSLLPVAGRTIDKMNRDPRFLKGQYEEYYNEAGLEYLQSSSLFAGEYRKFLYDSGIKRAELDFAPQGMLAAPEIDDTINISVYIPYYFVTTGRHCMMRTLTRPDNLKFVLDNTCGQSCDHYQIEMFRKGEKLNQTKENKEIRVYRKGNTIYGLNKSIGDLLKQNFYDRLIFQLDF